MLVSDCVTDWDGFKRVKRLWDREEKNLKGLCDVKKYTKVSQKFSFSKQNSEWVSQKMWEVWFRKKWEWISEGVSSNVWGEELACVKFCGLLKQ